MRKTRKIAFNNLDKIRTCSLWQTI